METEAKLLIPDGETRDRLSRCSAAAGFSLQPVRALTVRDTYLDTKERMLLAAGFACRFREESGRCIVTLKSTGGGVAPGSAGGMTRADGGSSGDGGSSTSGGSSGDGGSSASGGMAPAGSAREQAFHRRRELEVQLAGYDPEAAAWPARWPPCDARDLALAVVGDSPLLPLCCLRQDRLVRGVMDGRRLVATMSLDEVVVDGGSSWLELEIELAPAGRDRDLTALTTWAAVRFGLQPCPRSKLDRALDGAG